MTQTMVQAPTYSSSMRAHIDILLSRRGEWRRFRNQTTRVWFTVMPSLSNPDRVHQLTMSRCDCKGWQVRRYCAHVLALREAMNHETLPPKPIENSDAALHPACMAKNCQESREDDQYCWRHVLVDAL